MDSGRNRRLPSTLPDEAVSLPDRPHTRRTMPPTSQVAQVAHASQVTRVLAPARAGGTEAADTIARVTRRRWPRVALGVLIAAVLLVVVLVPPPSLRATLVTLLIVAVLGAVVWRLPMADDED